MQRPAGRYAVAPPSRRPKLVHLLIAAFVVVAALVLLLARRDAGPLDRAIPRQDWRDVQAERVGGSRAARRPPTAITRDGYSFRFVPASFADPVDTVMVPGSSVYVLERGGAIRRFDLVTLTEAERIDVGQGATAMIGTSGGLVLQMPEGEVLCLVLPGHEVRSAFRVPDLEKLYGTIDESAVLALAGPRSDPSLRRLLMLSPSTLEVFGSWTLEQGGWSSGAMQLQSLDAVAYDTKDNSIFVLDGQDLWRLSCCDPRGLDVLEVVPGALRYPGDGLTVASGYVAAYAVSSEWPPPSGGDRTSVYLRWTRDGVDCGSETSFGPYRARDLRFVDRKLIAAVGTGTIHVLGHQGTSGCRRAFRTVSRIDVGGMGATIDALQVVSTGSSMAVRSGKRILVGRGSLRNRR